MSHAKSAAPTDPDTLALLGPMVASLTAVGNVLVGLTVRALDQQETAVTMQQFRVMTLLAAAPLSVVNIAKHLGVQSSTATRMSDRLVRKQLIRREERLDDRRITWAVLTPTGRDFVDTVLDHQHEAITALVQAVSDHITPDTPVLLRAIAAAGGCWPPPADPLIAAIARMGQRP